MAPVPLIKVEKGKFVLRDEGKRFFESIPSTDKIAIVCLAGAYRTGKSFLLNKLLDVSVKEGFKTSSSTDACTQGLWIWADTIPITQDGEKVSLIFIDSEGSGSSHGNEHDSKVFALAVMLSTLFMYNTVGTIEEKHIDALATIAEVAKSVKQKNRAHAANDFFPSLLWILRDFSLQHEGTATDYLYKCLAEVNASGSSSAKGDNVTAQNRARATLKTVFPHHECMTLVRPANDESVLNRLDVDSKHIRPAFNEGIDKLSNFITSHAHPKSIGGVAINARAFIALASELVNAMNSDDLPDIRSSWDNVVGFAAIEAKDNACSVYQGHLEAWMKQFGQTAAPDDLTDWHRTETKTLLNIYDRALLNSTPHTDKIREQLIKYMETMYDSKCTLMSERFNVRIQKYLEEPSRELVDYARKDDANPETLVGRLRSILEGFHKSLPRSQQTPALLVIESFVTERVPAIFLELCDSVGRRVESEVRREAEHEIRRVESEFQSEIRQLRQQQAETKEKAVAERESLREQSYQCTQLQRDLASAHERVKSMEAEVKDAREIERRLGISEVARHDIAKSLTQAQLRVQELEHQLAVAQSTTPTKGGTSGSRKRARTTRDDDQEEEEEEEENTDLGMDVQDEEMASVGSDTAGVDDAPRPKRAGGTRGGKGKGAVARATKRSKVGEKLIPSPLAATTTRGKGKGKGKGGARKLDPADPPSIMKMKSDLKEAGVKFKGNAKPAEIRKLWKELAESS